MFRSFLRPVAVLAALSGLAAYATIMLRGPQGLNALADKHRQIRELEISNDEIAHEIEVMRTRITRLKTDPSAQEVELRRMGLVQKYDTRFQKTDPSVQGAVGGKSIGKR